MTENKRIALNVAATYGRSLYALAVGLFTGRWILMALGETDYGLYGVVGGLMAFVTFLNGLMAQSVSRFYAFSVGQARMAATTEEGIEECRRWFSVAVLIHTVLPVALVVVGYPIGVWAIERFLTIPPDRVGACVWVWRFACIGGFVGMVNVPFSAMYTAKQEIAELTVYSFAASTLMFGFTYYMVEHPGVWLTKYAVWTMLVSVVPQLVICVRALVKYPECRLRIGSMFDQARLSQVIGFAGARFLATCSFMSSAQGLVIAVNKYLGPAKNAAMSIGNVIAGHTSSLSSSIGGAFSPAITNAAGAGDYELMRNLIFRASRFSTAAVLLFSIPLSLEIEHVTVLWLKSPPAGVTVIAVFMLLDLVMARLSDGHMIGILALGRILKFQVWESIFFWARLLVGWFLVCAGLDLYAVGIAYLTTGAGSVLTKIWFGRSLCGLSARAWLFKVLFPLVGVAAATCSAGALPRIFLEASFCRLVVTTICCEAVFLPLVWFCVFTEDEKSVARNRFGKFLGRSEFKGGGGK